MEKRHITFSYDSETNGYLRGEHTDEALTEKLTSFCREYAASNRVYSGSVSILMDGDDITVDTLGDWKKLKRLEIERLAKEIIVSHSSQ